MVDKPIPCIRLARGKFELTIQESTGEKNSQENQASFLTGEDIKYARKGIYNFKTHTSLQKLKNMNHFVFSSFQFGAEMSCRRSAWQLARSSSSIAR